MCDDGTTGLRATDLLAGYVHVPVIRDLTLSVRPGEVVGLLGANGAGKTTLLRALSGSIRLWAGAVALSGIDITRIAPYKRVRSGLGHVPEGRHVFRAMTVSEHLAIAGRVAQDASARQSEVFDLFPRLAERRDQRAGSLSGGEQQMLAIGRALMTEPRILLVDEMSAGLAPVIAEQLVERLGMIRDRGTGILVVEQNPALIASVVDRVYLLEKGSIVADGTLEGVGGADRIAQLYLGITTTV